MPSRGLVIAVDVEGKEKIVAELKRLRAAGQAVLREAVLDGAEILRQGAEDRAPRRTGESAEHIVKSVNEKLSQGSSVTVDVGPDRAHYWLRILEAGAQAHEILPGAVKPETHVKDYTKGKGLFGRKKGKFTFKNTGKRSDKEALNLGGEELLYAKVEHPGFPAKPFLRPAFDEKQEEALRAVEEKLKRALGL